MSLNVELDQLVENFVEHIADSNNYQYIDFIREATYELGELDSKPGAFGYTEYEVLIYIDKVKFEAFNDKISEYQIIASDFFRSELDKHNFIVRAQFIKRNVKYIDWSYIKGLESKESLLDKINREKLIMIGAATGADRKEYQTEFKDLHGYLSEILPKIFLKHVHSYSDLNTMFRDLQAKFPHYKDRTIYINELFDKLIQTIEFSVVKDEHILEPLVTEWDEVNSIIQKMIVAKNSAKQSIDFQTVGLYGREVIKRVAQIVYIEDKHHPTDYPDIVGIDDAKRMLSGYFEHVLMGKKYKVERKHIYSLMELVDGLTHDKLANLFDANICVNAVIFMINLIHIIEKNIPKEGEAVNAKV